MGSRETLEEAVRESRLVAPGTRGVALLSGGADSACLAAGLAAAAGPGSFTGLHLNYGLRSDSGRDEEAARALCELLGVELRVIGAEVPHAENLQAAARDLRYAAAEGLRTEIGADWIATGHTRTDLAETVLYRLATSPGRRSLLGLRAGRGKVIRPLLALGRDETRSAAADLGLPFHDDPSNDEPKYARNVIRATVLPALREIAPAAEATIAATQAELAEEAEALDALAAELLAGAGVVSGAQAVPVAGLEPAPPALRRIAVRTLAERVTGRAVLLSPERFANLWRLAGSPEGGEVDIGGGAVARAESGVIRILAGTGEELPDIALPVPGSVRFGEWEVSALTGAGPGEPDGPDEARLAAELVEAPLEVRPWRDGDRMRPIGLDGTKSLQDLFTDRHVPRSLRRTLPVVVSGGRIAWVAGVAVSEDLRVREGPAVTLRARLLH